MQHNLHIQRVNFIKKRGKRLSELEQLSPIKSIGMITNSENSSGSRNNLNDEPSNQMLPSIANIALSNLSSSKQRINYEEKFSKLASAYGTPDRISKKHAQSLRSYELQVEAKSKQILTDRKMLDKSRRLPT